MLLSVSSSIAMSALRETRKSVACSIVTPGKSLNAFSRSSSCRDTKQRCCSATPVRNAIHCGRLVGTFTRTLTVSGESGSRSTKPHEVERFDMKGNACEGSSVSGVSAGETCWSK